MTLDPLAYAIHPSNRLCHYATPPSQAFDRISAGRYSQKFGMSPRSPHCDWPSHICSWCSPPSVAGATAAVQLPRTSVLALQDPNNPTRCDHLRSPTPSSKPAVPNTRPRRLRISLFDTRYVKLVCLCFSLLNPEL